ncbi:MAG: DUF362 domain-containing protein [Bacteroidales bacterium]|nr:DUF362 domain-containing protein [Bacteroidales bacterium]
MCLQGWSAPWASPPAFPLRIILKSNLVSPDPHCTTKEAFEKNSPCVSFEIMDMVRACPPGLTVIDASTSMEGNGPSDGDLVKTDLIIAGTNPLATDMVAAGIIPEGLVYWAPY